MLNKITPTYMTQKILYACISPFKQTHSIGHKKRYEGDAMSELILTEACLKQSKFVRILVTSEL